MNTFKITHLRYPRSNLTKLILLNEFAKSFDIWNRLRTQIVLNKHYHIFTL